MAVQKRTPNQSVSGAPEGTGTTSMVPTLAREPSSANLGRLYELPPEIRLMIYHRVLDHDDATPMVRHLVFSFNRPELDVQSAELANLRPQSWGLLTTIPEALDEALRLGWVSLPTSLVTFPGANVAHPDRGLTDRPLDSLPLSEGGNRRLLNPATTVFYVDQASLITLVNIIAVPVGGAGPSNRYAWLTDVVIESGIFQGMCYLPRPLGSDRPQPLDALPGLRRLTVGFLHRWQDVVMVEGPCSQVIEEARVDVHYVSVDENDSGGEPTVVQRVDVQLGQSNPVLELMISETVRHTIRTVRALNRAAVLVTWAFIRQGVTRRLEIDDRPRHVRR